MEINIEDLTTTTLPGEGIFDKIMSSMQVRLDREYKKNRIKGDNYAKVYLGSYETSLMNSIQFILGRQEADNKAEFIKEQTKTEIENRKLVNAQISKMIKEEQLIDGQIKKMKSEIKVMKQQVLESVQKVETMRATVWAERAKTNSTATIFDDHYDPSGLSEVTGLVGMQIKKAEHEGDLLEQKTLTEEAQTKDLVGPTPYAVVGVIGKQKNLYQRQADGFLRDAEQKLAKIMTDTWNTQMVSQDGIEASPAGLGYTDVCAVVNKARLGVDAGESVNCGGGENSGEIAGITVDIIAVSDVREDCLATFESHIYIDNIPGVSIKSWYWSTTEGRDTQGNTHKGPWNRNCGSEGPVSSSGQACSANGYGKQYLFETAFWEPGNNPVTLKAVFQDTDTSSKYHNHTITLTKQFNATATSNGGCMQDGPRPTNAVTAKEDAAATAYSVAHPEEHGASIATPANNGEFRTTEGHKGQTPRTVLP